jgi:hypothetical protein
MLPVEKGELEYTKAAGVRNNAPLTAGAEVS